MNIQKYILLVVLIILPLSAKDPKKFQSKEALLNQPVVETTSNTKSSLKTYGWLTAAAASLAGILYLYVKANNYWYIETRLQNVKAAFTKYKPYIDAMFYNISREQQIRIRDLHDVLLQSSQKELEHLKKALPSLKKQFVKEQQEVLAAMRDYAHEAQVELTKLDMSYEDLNEFYEALSVTFNALETEVPYISCFLYLQEHAAFQHLLSQLQYRDERGLKQETYNINNQSDYPLRTLLSTVEHDLATTRDLLTDLPQNHACQLHEDIAIRMNHRLELLNTIHNKVQSSPTYASETVAFQKEQERLRRIAEEEAQLRRLQEERYRQEEELRQLEEQSLEKKRLYAIQEEQRREEKRLVRLRQEELPNNLRDITAHSQETQKKLTQGAEEQLPAATGRLTREDLLVLAQHHYRTKEVKEVLQKVKI